MDAIKEGSDIHFLGERKKKIYVRNSLSTYLDSINLGI